VVSAAPLPAGYTRPLPMSEATLLTSVRQMAKLGKWLAFHDTDSRRNNPGLPDLVLLHPETGRLLFVELKSATGRIRPEQQQWIDALHRGGHTVRVWRPEQWHDGTIARALVTERDA
jgi:hypothetical protein